MQHTLPIRFIPAAITAVVIGFLLQLLMQSLLRTAPPSRQPAVDPVVITRAELPPPPKSTPTDSPPPQPVKRPDIAGLLSIEEVVTVAPPAGPTLNKMSPGVIAPPGPGAMVFSPTLPDQQARSRGPLLPAFPERARRAERNGVVIATFTVQTDGRASDVTIESAEPRGFGFEKAVRRVLQRATFSPATTDGTPVATTLRQQFVFELDER